MKQDLYYRKSEELDNRGVITFVETNVRYNCSPTTLV
jgi:hypothetical protein